MKKKIKVRICAGKNCKQSGALKIDKLLERLPDDLSTRVKVESCKCMEFCDDDRHGDPPFVKVKGKPISTSSAEKVISEVAKAIEHRFPRY